LVSFAYASYGLILCGVVQDIDSGYSFGRLSLKLVELLDIKDIKCKTLQVFGGFIIHWKEHFKETLPILIDAYQSGMEMGDFEYAGYSAFENGYHSYFIGHELTEIEQKISNYSKAISQIRRERPFNWIAIFLQAVRNLLGHEENPTLLSGDAYNEELALPLAIENK